MAAPVNDNFEDRILLTGESFSQAGTNVDATMQTGEDAYDAYGNRSVWYEWVAPQDGVLRLEVQSAVITDSTLAVYTGEALNALTLVAYDDDGGVGSLSALGKIFVQKDVSYKISVMGYSTSDVGAFTLVGLFSSSPQLANNIARTYSKFKLDVVSKNIDLSSDVIKVSLMKNTYVPDIVGDELWSDISSQEVSGAGYTAGGVVLSGISITQDSNGTIKINATDVVFSSITVSDWRYIVLHDVSNNDSLIGYIDLTSPSDLEGDTLTIIWDNNQNAFMEVY